MKPTGKHCPPTIRAKRPRQPHAATAPSLICSISGIVEVSSSSAVSHSSPNVGVSGKQWPTQGAGRGLSITELVHALAILGQCRINANRGPWQLFARAPLLTRDKDLSQPASGVDTTCWQLFRPAINTAHFYFLLQKLCQIT